MLFIGFPLTPIGGAVMVVMGAFEVTVFFHGYDPLHHILKKAGWEQGVELLTLTPGQTPSRMFFMTNGNLGKYYGVRPGGDKELRLHDGISGVLFLLVGYLILCGSDIVNFIGIILTIVMGAAQGLSLGCGYSPVHHALKLGGWDQGVVPGAFRWPGPTGV